MRKWVVQLCSNDNVSCQLCRLATQSLIDSFIGWPRSVWSHWAFSNRHTDRLVGLGLGLVCMDTRAGRARVYTSKSVLEKAHKQALARAGEERERGSCTERNNERRCHKTVYLDE